ncbi:hypothetical protein MC7420_4718 [Coleofasciculus chthonoplastes PCC 7420]|uniref:Uncharacterized protein n=1 Tax=Coleofasciculus chthonoplastes PCC 7420 TaxID=118168 RepID=B4VNJ7_9CYAN|nr:hypothetical protein MC7420_4718 [Coleofasciculus chthonoplastes PCC 7420]
MIVNSDESNSSSDSHLNENEEWELSDLVNAIAVEVELAQDILSLKSYTRGMSFAIKNLSLDVEVKVRRTPEGKLLFRSVDADQTSATVLKLDFAQVIESQLRDVRKPLDGIISAASASNGISVASSSNIELKDLEAITLEQIKAFNKVGLHSVDDLERYTQTLPMIAELSRLTGIPEHRIRMWRQLPFITKVEPESKVKLPDSIVIRGGNFGKQQGEVWFQQQTAEKITEIFDWQETSLRVKIPPTLTGTGLLYAKIDNLFTNVIPWKREPT